MQRKSWNASRLERLKAALKKAGNTPDAFNAMMEFEEFLPLEAQELSEQVRWPNPPKLPEFEGTVFAEGSRMQGPPAQVQSIPKPPMVVKRFTPPEPPPKIVIKRY